jgi:hypothetical protein
LQSGVLYLDSDVEGDDSEWDFAFAENRMIWTGRGDAWHRAFKIIQKKAENSE